MNNKKKACGLLFVGALAMATAGAGLLVNPAVKASAMGTETINELDTRFYMTGASIRFDDPTGLRFEALVGVDLATDEDVEFGMIIFPKNIMEMYNISMEYSATTNYHTEITTKAAEYIAQYPLVDMSVEPQAVYAENDTEKTTPINYTLWGSIAKIQYANLSRDWWGVAYAKEGDTYTYAEFANDVNVRNVVYVASAAASDTEYNYTETQIDIMKGFVSKSLYKIEGKTEEDANALVANKEWATFTAVISEQEVALEKNATKKLSVSANGLTVGATWSTDDESVATVDKYGVVTAVGYGETTITANCMGQTLTCDVTVAQPAEFTFIPENAFVAVGTAYTINPATANQGNVSWTVELYEIRSFGGSGAGVLSSTIGNSSASFTIEHYQYAKVTWTLTLDEFTQTATTFYLPNVGKDGIAVTELATQYSDYFAHGTLSTGLEKSEAFVGNTPWLHLYNGNTSVEGVYTSDGSVYLGDKASEFDFLVYNPSNTDVDLYIEGGKIGTLKAGGVMRLDHMNYWGWSVAVTGWNLADAKGCLKSIKIKAESVTAGVAADVYFGSIRLNKDAFDLGMPVLTGTMENNVATVTFNKTANATNYTYTVMENGVETLVDQVVDDAVEGVYTIKYDYTDTYANLAGIEIVVTAHAANGATTTATYKKNFMVFDFVPVNEIIATQTAYTLTPATASVGTVSWKVDYMEIRTDADAGNIYSTSDNNPTSVNIQWYQCARVTWTLTVGEFTETAYTYYLPNRNSKDQVVASLSEQYEDYFAKGTLSNAALTTANVVNGDAPWLHLNNGTTSANGTYKSDGTVYLGDGATSFDLFIYNASDVSVEVTLNGVSYTIKAKTMVRVDHINRFGWDAAVKGWSFADANRNLNEVSISATSDGVVDIYIGGIRTNGTFNTAS